MRLSKTAALVLAVLLFGCRTAPVPPEVLEADLQEQDLRGAGASLFAGREHAAYLQSLNSARRALAKENLKLGWFRDYGKVREEYAGVLLAGNSVRSTIQTVVSRRATSLAQSAEAVRRRLRTLDDLTLSLVERGAARGQLTRASLALGEADTLIRQAHFEEAQARLDKASGLAAEAEKSVLSRISRYLDPAQVRSWKTAAEETIAESKRRGTTVLIVSKLERRLAVYDPALFIPVDQVELPGAPGRMVVDDAENALFVALPESREVAVVDLGRRRVVARIELPDEPHAVAVVGERN